MDIIDEALRRNWQSELKLWETLYPSINSTNKSEFDYEFNLFNGAKCKIQNEGYGYSVGAFKIDDVFAIIAKKIDINCGLYFGILCNKQYFVCGFEYAENKRNKKYELYLNATIGDNARIGDIYNFESMENKQFHYLHFESIISYYSELIETAKLDIDIATNDNIRMIHKI